MLPGLELPDQRRVKRGWTDHNDKDTRPKRRKKDDDKAQPSKYSEKDELLFRTDIPPNKAPLDDKSGKGKKGKDKGKAIVHEFSNTTKHPSFLRASGDGGKKRATKKYDDEKGWVADDGAVVEPKLAGVTKGLRASKKDVEPLQEGATSSSGEDNTSSDEHSSNEDNVDEVAESSLKDDSNSDSESSEESSSDEDNPNPTAAEETTQPAVPADSNAKEQHPLEALFKRPKPKPTVKPSLEVNTTFTFFDPDEDEAKPPHTPFTMLDRRQRDIRSAAPTPDTPAPGTVSFSARQLRSRLADQTLQSKNRDREDSPSTRESSTRAKDRPSHNKGGKAEESEFVKWFWEHRGETNRTWKRRRREAAKEERQRENRKRAGR